MEKEKEKKAQVCLQVEVLVGHIGLELFRVQMITCCFYQTFFRMRTSQSIFLNIGHLNLQCVYQGERGRRNRKTRLALVGVYPIALTEGPTFSLSLGKTTPLKPHLSFRPRMLNNICTQGAGGVEKVQGAGLRDIFRNHPYFVH